MSISRDMTGSDSCLHLPASSPPRIPWATRELNSQFGVELSWDVCCQISWRDFMDVPLKCIASRFLSSLRRSCEFYLAAACFYLVRQGFHSQSLYHTSHHTSHNSPRCSFQSRTTVTASGQLNGTSSSRTRPFRPLTGTCTRMIRRVLLRRQPQSHPCQMCLSMIPLLSGMRKGMYEAARDRSATSPLFAPRHLQTNTSTDRV
jgi:hypothetical protein